MTLYLLVLVLSPGVAQNKSNTSVHDIQLSTWKGGHISSKCFFFSFSNFFLNTFQPLQVVFLWQSLASPHSDCSPLTTVVCQQLICGIRTGELYFRYELIIRDLPGTLPTVVLEGGPENLSIFWLNVTSSDFLKANSRSMTCIPLWRYAYVFYRLL